MNDRVSKLAELQRRAQSNDHQAQFQLARILLVLGKAEKASEYAAKAYAGGEFKAKILMDGITFALCKNGIPPSRRDEAIDYFKGAGFTEEQAQNAMKAIVPKPRAQTFVLKMGDKTLARLVGVEREKIHAVPVIPEFKAPLPVVKRELTGGELNSRPFKK